MIYRDAVYNPTTGDYSFLPADGSAERYAREHPGFKACWADEVPGHIPDPDNPYDD